MSNTKLKPLYLMDIFREMTDEEHRLTVPELVEELQRRGIHSERKGIYRDIDALVEYGADIRKTGTGYYLAGRELTQTDLRAVAWALRSTGFVSRRRYEAIMEKLPLMGGEHICKKLIRSRVYAPKAEYDDTFSAIEVLDRAIAGRRQVTFTYDKTRDPLLRRRRISPYGLMYVKGEYYIACNIEGRNNISCLSVSSMRAVRSDLSPWKHFSEVSEYRGDFPLEEFAARAIKNGMCNE